MVIRYVSNTTSLLNFSAQRFASLILGSNFVNVSSSSLFSCCFLAKFFSISSIYFSCYLIFSSYSFLICSLIRSWISCISISLEISISFFYSSISISFFLSSSSCCWWTSLSYSNFVSISIFQESSTSTSWYSFIAFSQSISSEGSINSWFSTSAFSQSSSSYYSL